MSNFRLVIAGAIYYDEDNDIILMPHYTGCWGIVDATEYKKIEEIKDSYDDDFIEDNKEDYYEYGGEKYFYAEYSPRTVTDKWELLSDLSELKHLEENRDFD